MKCPMQLMPQPQPQQKEQALILQVGLHREMFVLLTLRLETPLLQVLIAIVLQQILGWHKMMQPE